jgi:hypothetical protein
LSQKLLHDPIFERVECDHHETSAGPQTSGCDLQNRSDFVKFGIDDNSDGLKSPRRRIFAGRNRAWPASNDPGNQGREFSGATQGVFTSLKTSGHDCSGNRYGRSFFAV